MREESHQVGSQTMAMLVQQTEQLDQIEDNMEQAANDLKTASRHLKNLQRNFWFDFCTSLLQMFGCDCFAPKLDFETDPNLQDLSWLSKVRSTLASTILSVFKRKDKYSDTDAKIALQENALQKTNFKHEFNNNLGQVENLVVGLHKLAIEMGTEIDRQNGQVDRITVKAKNNDFGLQKANRTCNRLL